MQTDAARTRGDEDRGAVPKDSRSVRAAIVVDTVLARIVDPLDVRVTSRYGGFRHRNMIRPRQAIPVVANFSRPSDVDPRCRKDVAPGVTARHTQLQIRCRKTRHRLAIELDMK